MSWDARQGNKVETNVAVHVHTATHMHMTGGTHRRVSMVNCPKDAGNDVSLLSPTSLHPKRD